MGKVKTGNITIAESGGDVVNIGDGVTGNVHVGYIAGWNVKGHLANIPDSVNFTSGDMFGHKTLGGLNIRGKMPTAAEASDTTDALEAADEKERHRIIERTPWLRELLEKTPDGLALVANASTIVQLLRDLARSLS